MGLYAQSTSVSVDRSKSEIEQTLTRYGATGFAYATDSDKGSAMIAFKISNRAVRITLPLPDMKAEEFRPKRLRVYHVESERRRELWEQACRSSWRSLSLVIKAKLEAVASGISTVEREFFPDIILSNGQTMGEWTAPQLKTMFEDGKMPKLLPLGEPVQ